MSDWIQTYTGKAFYPMDPRPDNIDPADIARALAMLCRFGGHVRRFYSVAEHCVLMSYAVTPQNALWALLHDAAEGLGLVDLPRPVKRAIPLYRAVEDRVMEAVCKRFDLDPVCPAEVQAADTRILRDERAALKTPPPLPWMSLENVDPLGVEILALGPDAAELAYLGRLRELGVTV